MKRFTRFLAASGLACIMFVDNSVSAQSIETPPQPTAAAQGGEWTYGPTSQVEPKTAGRQRAEMRAQQRLTRLNSMRWYGFTPGRPQATGIPFTSMYSPAWSRPGGRPYAWYISHQPITTPYYPVYYR